MSIAARGAGSEARAVVLALVATLAACQSPPAPLTRPPVGFASASTPATAASHAAPEAGSRLLHIDSESSRIELRLAAAGPFAGLGHAHLIVAHALAGEVILPPELVRTRFELHFPVAALSVDDAQERAAAGGEYAAPIPETARAGTREHMLGPGQLEAARFAEIVVRAQSLRVMRGDAAAGEGEIDASVQLLGRSVPLTVPVRWEQSTAVLAVQGELRLLQSALGIQPYSVGGGALRVADEVEVRFQLRAR